MTISLYQSHVAKWRDCTACDLHRTRGRVVLAKGKIPCDVLFVAEAPGHSEDTIGLPMVGPAGRLLDEIVALSGIGQFRIAHTNVIACIPKGEDGDKVAEPPDESIEACSARLVEFITIARPRLIVQVGKVAQDWLTPGYKHSIKLHDTIPMVFISHPAAILRAREDQKGYQKQRVVIALRDAVDLL